MRLTVQGGVLSLLFLLTGMAFGAEPAHDAALLERLVAAQQGHTTVQGRLRWLTSRIDDPTTPPREQHVRFFLAFPNRYAVVVTKPGDEESKTSFISDGITRWELTQFLEGVAPDKKTTPVGDGDEVEQRLLACFRFDLAVLQKDFTVVATPIPDGSQIILTPVGAKLKEQLTVLVLSFDDKQKLGAIRSEDPQGNRLTFAVQEATYDQPLDDALFRVVP